MIRHDYQVTYDHTTIDVTSAHSDNPKRLYIHIVIPKQHYKGSNTSDVDAVLRMKSAWLRGYGEVIWSTAIEKEFGVTAIEPNDWTLADTTDTPSEQRDRAAYNDQQKIVDDLHNDLSILQTDMSVKKAACKSLPRSSSDAMQLREELSVLKEDERKLKLRVRLESKLLTRRKNMFNKTHDKQNRRRDKANRISYLREKSRLNEHQLIFPHELTLMVRSNVITKHDFDAPNCWPSVKPLQDGGTDTCILWHDDNNTYIKATTFYGGQDIIKDHYVIDMIANEVSSSLDDPFSIIPSE